MENSIKANASILPSDFSPDQNLGQDTMTVFTTDKTDIIYYNNHVLGSGAFSRVFLGKFGGSSVAVKRVPLKNMLIKKQPQKESLMNLDHDNVVKLFHHEDNSVYRYYVLELCRASLDKFFKPEEYSGKYNGPIMSKTDMLFDLANGLQYIHSKELVHCSVKPSSALIWVSDDDKSCLKRQVLIKWADFGLYRNVTEYNQLSMPNVTARCMWLAPEILHTFGKFYDADDEKLVEARRGTKKSDVFALGLVFTYILLGGKHPFGSPLVRNRDVKKLEEIPVEYKWALPILLNLLQSDPNKRMTAEEVVKQLCSGIYTLNSTDSISDQL